MGVPSVGADRREPSADVLTVVPPPTFVPLSSAGLPLAAARLFVVTAEVVLVLAAAIVSKLAYLDWLLNSHPPVEPYIAIGLVMSAAVYIVYNQMGLYEINNLTRAELGVGSIVGGLLIALVTVLGTLYSLKQLGDLSRGWVFLWLGLMAVSITSLRYIFSRWAKAAMASGLLLQRIAIIGTKDFPLELATRIRAAEGLSGAIDLYHYDSSKNDIRFSGGLQELEETMAVRPYDRVVVGFPSSETEAIRRTVRLLGAYTSELFLCTDLAPASVAMSGKRPIMGIKTEVVQLVPKSEYWALLKRTMDAVVAASLLVLLAPLLLIAAVAIRLESSGPVLFRQRRIGRNSTVFRIYKFRTMNVVEDGSCIVQATRDDHRVTRVGRFLRKTSIDELPQLLNVLAGDMSLVGPRPHAIAHDVEFEQKFDLFARRRRVKPGITGWAQVNGFRGETTTTEDIRRRMEHDLDYIENWSIWLDVEILVRTAFVLAKGAY